VTIHVKVMLILVGPGVLYGVEDKMSSSSTSTDLPKLQVSGKKTKDKWIFFHILPENQIRKTY